MTIRDNAATTAIILQPGEGRTLPGPEGFVLKATAAQTGGALSFFEATSEPGFGPPRHIHHDHDEIFYVLDGRFRFLVDEQLVDAPPGTFVFVPRGTVHAVKVISERPGKVLSGFVPGGAEAVFEERAEMAAMAEDESSEEQLQAIAARYGSEFVGPPL